MALKKTEVLAKFLSYVLGRRPDEFGLVPDSQGYVKIKELLKVLSEEPGWKHVRRAGLKEIRISLPQPPIEFDDAETRIRATDRSHLPSREAPAEMPKLLYTCVRQKAHPVVVEKGISPMGREHVILSDDPNMAKRLGRRIDPDPLLLIVNVQQAVAQGVLWMRSGETLYLSRFIPPDCFTAPPLPEKPEPKPKKKEPAEQKPRDQYPGSFFPDFAESPLDKKKSRHAYNKKEKEREKWRKRSRREKRKRQGI